MLQTHSFLCLRPRISHFSKDPSCLYGGMDLETKIWIEVHSALLELNHEMTCFKPTALILVLFGVYLPSPILLFNCKRRNKVILHMLARTEDVTDCSQMCDDPIFSSPMSHARNSSYSPSWAHLDSGVGHHFARGDARNRPSWWGYWEWQKTFSVKRLTFMPAFLYVTLSTWTLALCILSFLGSVLNKWGRNSNVFRNQADNVIEVKKWKSGQIKHSLTELGS